MFTTVIGVPYNFAGRTTGVARAAGVLAEAGLVPPGQLRLVGLPIRAGTVRWWSVGTARCCLAPWWLAGRRSAGWGCGLWMVTRMPGIHGPGRPGRRQTASLGWRWDATVTRCPSRWPASCPCSTRPMWRCSARGTRMSLPPTASPHWPARCCCCGPRICGRRASRRPPGAPSRRSERSGRGGCMWIWTCWPPTSSRRWATPGRWPHLGRAGQSGRRHPVEARLPGLDAVQLQPRPRPGPNRGAEDRRRSRRHREIPLRLSL
jgi:hypothetical protein